MGTHTACTLFIVCCWEQRQYCMPTRRSMFNLFMSAPGHPYMLSHMRDIMLSLSCEHTPGLSSGTLQKTAEPQWGECSRIEAVQRLQAFSGCDSSDAHTLTMLNLSTNLPAAEVCSTIVLARPDTTMITRGFDQHSLSKRATMRQDGHPRPVHTST